MFTPGQIAFVIFFVMVFVLAMVWSYKKDSFSTKTHFKGSYKIIIYIVLVFLALFLFVKFRQNL